MTPPAPGILDYIAGAAVLFTLLALSWAIVLGLSWLLWRAGLLYPLLAVGVTVAALYLYQRRVNP